VFFPFFSLLAHSEDMQNVALKYSLYSLLGDLITCFFLILQLTMPWLVCFQNWVSIRNNTGTNKTSHRVQFRRCMIAWFIFKFVVIRWNARRRQGALVCDSSDVVCYCPVCRLRPCNRWLVQRLREHLICRV